MQPDDFNAMQKSAAQLEKYIDETYSKTPLDQEDIEAFQLYTKRDPEVITQRQRVKEMFKRYLITHDLKIEQDLSQEITSQNIVDLYSDISNIALLVTMPHLESFSDLLGHRLEAFNQILYERRLYLFCVSIQLAAQLDESVPSKLLEKMLKFKKIAIAEAKGLSAVRELFSLKGQNLNGQIAWLIYRLYQEADYLKQFLLDHAPVAKRESINSNLRRLKRSEEIIQGTLAFVSPSEKQQIENQHILETHKGFRFFVEIIDTQAVKLA
jgi:hypothetical protein